METGKPPTGWDRAVGLSMGVAFCGFVWVLWSYLLPLVMSGQGWVAPGTGEWGGIVLMVVGVVAAILVATVRPRDETPKE